MSASDFTLEQTQKDGETYIVMSGLLSETAVLAAPESKTSPVRINAEGVKRINSIGVGMWIRFMATLRESGRPIVIERLPVPLVTQANMISNFLTGATVESYYAPYFCEKCNSAHDQLHPSSERAPEGANCPTCATPMEFDDDHDHYFGFLG